MQELKKHKLILASKSPRRKELLANLGLDFEIMPADLAEQCDNFNSFGELVMELARQKGEHIASQHPGRIIIASDTIVVIDNQVLNKPSDIEDAKNMLRTLSGRQHQVYTSLYILDGQQNKIVSDYSVTDVFFITLTEEDIERYVATGEPFDKAGAYGIQGFGSKLVEKISGCFFSVMGFPVALFARRMKELGYHV